MVQTAEGSTRLLLRPPDDCNYFTRDPAEIERMRLHFAEITEQLRARCAELGITVAFVTPCSGEAHLQGDHQLIDQLTTELRGQNCIL